MDQKIHPFFYLVLRISYNVYSEIYLTKKLHNFIFTTLTIYDIRNTVYCNLLQLQQLNGKIQLSLKFSAASYSLVYL